MWPIVGCCCDGLPSFSNGKSFDKRKGRRAESNLMAKAELFQDLLMSYGTPFSSSPFSLFLSLALVFSFFFAVTGMM